MRRIISLLAVMAIMAALVAASAMPAFAASENSNCVGERAVLNNQLGKERGDPGNGGRIVAQAGKDQMIGGLASTNGCGG